MSYDIYLSCACCGHTMSVENHEEGGTYVMGGTSEAWLNVSYNYGPYYYRYLDGEKGIRWLYEKTGRDVTERLHAAIAAIEADTEVHAEQMVKIEEGRRKRREAMAKGGEDAEFYRKFGPGPEGYWLPTKENAAASLRTLLAWAKQHPTAVFSGD